jgi:hypothetical protein
MAKVPADGWLLAVAILAGAALLASIAFALLFAWVARRFFGLPSSRALAFSFATQAAVILLAWLAVDDPRDGLRLHVVLLAPVALAHLLIAPFLRQA